ncbi:MULTISPECIES: 50S ribosomal protein L18 [Anaerococcus]|uniref:Large ribosomal subunit protein uL18 n=3 Tax=Anaerococcus hydrogenalis TaxID=33029 RepID=F0H1W0_9FIRM|nr:MULTISPECIES: 50S ribosomal protein L18 [Anaerococcus]EEB35326.1 ribosomal protein L18 [Anaerococcus hydrogenalis DSM 7454]EGC83473.1 ribosomal protein L18 [Anaerococcus hydrogenalis ACS-025-V-Sch4]MBS5988201.1 50S ribosomal protein L18 [Anaerococcus hydrogenalis]MDK7694796.1 50S ribosomal protein L18 [Anaerococcus hydrogenalis]MDK7696650.1 50S ribosomal protein L18 [Anaerococcus hydrogenalis]
MAKKTKEQKLKTRKYRVRNKVSGTAQKPRLSVYKSNTNIYAQLIDDDAQVTLASANTLQKEVNEGLENCANIEAATKVGEMIAKVALDKGIEEVVFDRNGYLYHGKVKALAEAARENGLKF